MITNHYVRIKVIVYFSRETDDIIFCQPTVRPFRKRTMSESDKLDRGKKYRTG